MLWNRAWDVVGDTEMGLSFTVVVYMQMFVKKLVRGRLQHAR